MQYREAVTAQLYYNGENPTINRYEKIIYDMKGLPHKDMWTANHKIASKFFGFAVDQLNGYLLGNGITFRNPETKQRLGTKTKPFDQQMMIAGEYALIGGVSFVFWNLDHVDVFAVTEFVPLYDDENGALSAGIRFWQIDSSKPLRATLYEPDGYTEYIRREGENMTVYTQKRSYVQQVRMSDVDGAEIFDGNNYPTFPIVPLKNNKECASELRGRRNTIDALDLASSNMVNNVDEGNLIYWVINNAGGMDDLDDQKFLEHIRRNHVAHTEDGTSATPHSIEAPFNGTQATIDMLKRQLYEDFQAFDSSAVSAGNQTATAIQASYIPLDMKADKFERQVTMTVNAIQVLAGTDDDPTYTRNQIINKQEEVQTLLLAADYLTPEYITKRTMTIFGDADQIEDVLNEQAANDLTRFGMGNEED